MLLIPLFSSTTLRNTILAVSANQLFLLGDTRYFREACLYKAKAVTRLTQVDGTSMVDFDIVASVLMLCFHDVRLSLCVSPDVILLDGLQFADDELMCSKDFG